MRMPLLPLLLSSIAVPAAAGQYSFCYTEPDSVDCLIRQIEFEQHQNALARASVARVEARRAHELALSLTHCKSRWSRTPRCQAERAQRFAAAQNRLADASIERVNKVRAAEAARNADIAAYVSRIEAQRQRRLEIQQNKLINASIAAVEAQKQLRFAARQNALATASVIRVEIERNRQLALSLSPCKSADDQRPRCLAQRDREFASQQNALANASVARVNAERERAFAAARNAEINRSVAAVARNRIQTTASYVSHCAKNAASPRCEAEQKNAMQLALTHCKSAADASPRCEAERNNNSITTASVDKPAALSAAEYAALTSHCARAPASPRCEAERIRDFAAARNAEIERLIAADERNRMQMATYYTSPCAKNAASPRCAAELARELAMTHCKSASDASPRCEAERARNSVTTASLDKPAALSAAEYAALTSHCVRAPASPRCEAERIRDFAAARNAEIDRSIAAVERNRARLATYYTSQCAKNAASPRCEAERARNSVTTASLDKPAALSAAEYAALTSHCVRAPASPRCEAERIRDFAAARNAEIDRSIAAVAAARANKQANAATDSRDIGTDVGISAYDNVFSPLETGALGVLPRPTLPDVRPLPEIGLRHDISAETCRATGTPFGPLHFTGGVEIDADMRPELNRLARLAATCPGMRIEIHGYSDGRGSAFINRSMAQARAQSVADYLIAAGIAPNRLAAMGRGAYSPVLPYSKGIGPDYGRRVEFVIKDPALDAAARKVMWDLAELLDPTYVPAVARLSP